MSIDSVPKNTGQINNLDPDHWGFELRHKKRQVLQQEEETQRQIKEYFS